MTAKYTKQDWARISARQNELNEKLADLMDKDPEGPQVQELVNERRQFITDNFYTCTPEILRGLGEMYVDDERFACIGLIYKGFEKLSIK